MESDMPEHILDRAVPPAVHVPASSSLPPMDEILLPGGTLLKVYDKGSLPVNSIIAVRNGGLAEFPTPAMAQLYGRVFNEASLRYPSADVAELLDFNGSWCSASCSSHHLIQKFYSLNSRFEEVLPVIADLVMHPAFPEHELEVLGHTLANEIEVNRTKVRYLASEVASAQAMGAAHPLARRSFATDALSVTTGILKECFARYVDPKNLTIYLSGRVTDSMVSRLSDIFTSAPSGRDAEALDIMPFSPEANGEPVVIDRPDSSQSAIVMTLPAVPRTHPDYLPLHIAVMALGGYFGSRLMQNIREEKGLTYGISAGLLGYMDGAYVQIYTEADNSYARRVVEEVKAELLRLADNPPEGDELDRLCRSAITGQLEILDTPLSIAAFHSVMQTSGIPDGYFEEKQALISSLTPDIISLMARRYLRPELLTIAAAGNSRLMNF